MTNLRQAAQQALEALESGLAFAAHSAVLQNLRTALAQPEQEPVAWISPSGALYRTRFHAAANGEQLLTPLYTTPPQRPWQGLTDEEFLEACQLAERGNYLVAFQRIQIKLKERNNG